MKSRKTQNISGVNKRHWFLSKVVPIQNTNYHVCSHFVPLDKVKMFKSEPFFAELYSIK